MNSLKFILLLNFSPWTCSGHIKHVLLTCNYLLSYWEVSWNQRIQQPLFHCYPKNITTNNAGHGEPPKTKCKMNLMNIPHLLHCQVTCWSDGNLWVKDRPCQLRDANISADHSCLYKQALTTDLKHIQLSLLFHVSLVFRNSHKAPDHVDASYFHIHLISTNLYSFYTCKSSSDWL